MFVLLTFSRLLVSRLCRVRAFLPSPMFVLLTFSCFLVSRKCVLFPHRPCLSCSLFLAFSSLANCTTFHSFHQHPHHLFCLKPYRKIWNKGLLKTWDSRDSC
ncbi:hypothetical protein B0H14DRAFT_57427 [Mycena olivaceomarginata]|nr:hypothetical protein B0H14DRAFT_57427 [Mycena olivaceomarginata]